MKKIAFTLAAVASLGLAACTGSNDEAGNNAADMNTTATETGMDTNESANDAAAVDATNNGLDAAGNLVSDAGNSIENGAAAVSNAVTNTAE
jgi:hypothetical protein